MKRTEKFYYELSYRYFTEAAKMSGLCESFEIFENENLLAARDAVFCRYKELLKEILVLKTMAYNSDDEAHEKVWEILFPSEVISLKIPKSRACYPSDSTLDLSITIGISNSTLINHYRERDKVYLQNYRDFYEVNILPYDIKQFIRISLIKVIEIQGRIEEPTVWKSDYCIHGIEYHDAKPVYLQGLIEELNLFRNYVTSDEYKTRLVVYRTCRSPEKGLILPTPYTYFPTIEDILNSL